MQKLKYDIIKKLMESEVTSTEINLLIYMSHYQSDRGSITGVYYKSVSDDLNISYQAFYDALYGLQKKGFIMIRKGSYYDWDVLILDNDYRNRIYKGPDEESYLNTGLNLFYDKKFYKLKVKEKLLLMSIFVWTRSGKQSYHKNAKDFYKKYCNIFRVTKRVLQGYLTSLRQFLFIGIKARTYWMKPLKEFCEKGKAPTDNVIFAKGFVKTVVRRTRADFTPKAYEDIEKTVSNYSNNYTHTILQYCFIRAVEKSMQLRNYGIANKYKWNRKLYPAFIHKLLDQELLEYDGSIS